jgi:small subunit ribosomal protein S17
MPDSKPSKESTEPKSQTSLPTKADKQTDDKRSAVRLKQRQGIVISDKADKTITIRVDAARRHARYERIVHSFTKLHVHDESNTAHTGDTVRVIECRPRSHTKRWRLLEVIERAK